MAKIITNPYQMKLPDGIVTSCDDCGEMYHRIYGCANCFGRYCWKCAPNHGLTKTINLGYGVSKSEYISMICNECKDANKLEDFE